MKIQISIRHYLLVLILAWVMPVMAETTYEDLTGNFMIDLPDGFELLPQQVPNLYQFSGESGRIIMVVDEENRDRDALYSEAYSMVEGSLTTLQAEQSETNIKLNGNPVYKEIQQ